MKNLDLLSQLESQLVPLLSSSRLWMSNNAIQHGDTTVLLHSLAVAYFSMKLAGALRLKHDQRSLLRGALLHDYFLYDWHDSSSHRPFHGFHHAATALKNAEEDFALSNTERDIILHHMFPLNPAPPRSREAVLVCLVDKGCGLYETVSKNTYPGLRALLRKHQTSFTGEPNNSGE